MNYRQDPAYAQKDQFVEQIMIEQLRKTRFPPISEWNPAVIIKEEDDGVPLLTFESFRRFINGISDVRIPKDSQIIVTHHPGHSSVVHCHDHYEACFILSGSCTSIINNHLAYLKEGDFCLMPPLSRHDYEFRPDSLVLCFSIQPALFSGIGAPLLDDHSPVSHFLLDSLYKANHEQYLIFQTGCDRLLRIIGLTMFQAELKMDKTENRMLENLLMALFAGMMKYPLKHIQSAPSGSKLLDLDLLNMIRQNFATITLTDLSKYLHYTVPHCSKYLKEHLGCTFSELVRQIRFQAAEDYLLHSSMSVNQISETLGYESPENFIRAFRKVFGTTPTKYRQQHRE